MKRKILTIILAITMVLVSIPVSVVFATGSKANYTVTANKTTAVAGDEIEFSVKLDLINKMTAFEFTLDIPSGLTLVPGSQTAIARDVLGFDNVNNNESALLVSGYGSNPYTATGTLTLATFKCTVDSNAVGKYTVGLKDTVLNDDEYEEEAHDVTSVEINVVIPATGISIKETTTLTEGNTEQLTATLTPANTTDTVSWTSNNESVATVSSTGLVTAVKKGTATITATAGNVSDTCAVTVNCAHANTTPHTAVSSTCKVQGHGAYTTCDDCGEVISGSNAKLPLADHNYGTWINEQPATHDANGVKGHYHCSVCEKNFDSSKNELSSLVITKDANHGTPDSAWKTDATYHWHECKVVGCGVVIDSTKAKHTFEWKTDKPATEDETGLKHEECSVCGLKRNENTPISKLDHTHTGITYHAAVAATCKATGNIEYWTCSSTKCSGKYYSDSLCQNEITTGIITSKDSSNHDGETEYRNSKPATCYAKGYEGDIYCLGCGNKIGTGKDIDMLNHTPGNWETDATYHWKECTVVACGVVIESTKEQHTGGEATCKNKAVCSVCGVEYGEKNADNHKSTTIINAKTPTCTEAGYTGDTYCNDCEKTVANGTSIVPNGHTPSEWQFDDDEHWQTCAVDGCGVEIADSRASHSESEWIVDKEPTVKEEGSKHIECTVCRKVLKTESIAKLIAYEITNGVNGKWTKESKENISFTSNAEFAKFVEVRVDGKKISEGSFIVKEGSTVVTLKNDYLETLLVGKHTLAIVSSDGIAETSFEIEGTEKKDTPVSPLTGENSHMTLWIILASVSCLGVLGSIFTKKKKSVR